MIFNLVSKMMFRSFLADRDNRLVELCHSRTRARVPIGKGAHSSDVRKLAADYTREGSCSGKSPTKSDMINSTSDNNSNYSSSLYDTVLFSR